MLLCPSATNVLVSRDQTLDLPVESLVTRDYQRSWDRGTQSSSSALALLPSVFACVHVSVRSIVGLLSRVQPTHPTVSAFAVLARSVAFSPSPQGFRPHSFLCSAVCAVTVSAVYRSHLFSNSRVHAHVAEDYESKAVETRDKSI